MLSIISNIEPAAIRSAQRTLPAFVPMETFVSTFAFSRVYEKLCSVIIPAMNRQAYPRDLTDQHRSIIEPLLPPAKSGGRQRSVR